MLAHFTLSKQPENFKFIKFYRFSISIFLTVLIFSKSHHAYVTHNQSEEVSSFGFGVIQAELQLFKYVMLLDFRGRTRATMLDHRLFPRPKGPGSPLNPDKEMTTDSLQLFPLTEKFPISVSY